MDASELLKKGVPSKLPLPIQFEVDDLARVCKKSNIIPALKEARENIFKLIADRFGEEFAFMFYVKNNNYAEIYIDENTLDKKIVMTTSLILSRIEILLDNYDIEFYDIEEMNSLIEKLKNMSEKEMKDKYPSLYDYCSHDMALRLGLANYKRNFRYMNFQNIVAREKVLSDLYGVSVKTIDNMIKKSPANYNYNSFLSKFTQILEIIRDNMQEFVSPTLGGAKSFVDVNIEIAEEDKEKFSLYTTYLYQEKLKKMKEQYRQEYLYYISAYYFENKERLNDNIKFYSQYYDKIIKISDMYEDYKKILTSNPQLKIVDFNYSDFNDMTLAEVEDFINEYLKTINVNWDFLTASSLDEEIINKIKGYYTKNSKEINQNDLEKDIDLFIEKKEFFDRSDPYYRIMGKNSFDGYIGYIYKNGSVVLEKFFENSKTGRVAKNQAIYAMNVNEFYYLTAMSKNEIIANKLCSRFIHKGDWKTKVKNYIDNMDSTVDVVSEVAELKSSSI